MPLLVNPSCRFSWGWGDSVHENHAARSVSSSIMVVVFVGGVNMVVTSILDTIPRHLIIRFDKILWLYKRKSFWLCVC